MAEIEKAFTEIPNPIRCETLIARILTEVDGVESNRFTLFIDNGILKCRPPKEVPLNVRYVGTVSRIEVFGGLTTARWCQLGKSLHEELSKELKT